MLELIHIVLAFIALVAGGAVFGLKKGNQKHRIVGRVYFLSMVGLNLTAFGIYNLFGRWGMFHWLALASLVTVVAGYIAIRYKNVLAHYYFMVWSYVGLLGGAISELFARFPPAISLQNTVPLLDSYLILAMIGATFYLLPKYQSRFVIKRTKP